MELDPFLDLYSQSCFDDLSLKHIILSKVSTKTLRYYAEIGLILPDEINPENVYRIK